MIKGDIFLYDMEGTLVCSFAYDKKEQRTRKIKKWEKLYGREMRHCYLQIAPHIESDLTHSNGENRVVYRCCQGLEDEQKESIERPPTVYSNKTFI